MKAYANGKINDRVEVAGNAIYPAYVIKGSKKNLMIDAGINWFGPLYVKSLREILGSSQKLNFLFLTHSHYDHLGAVSYLRRKLPNVSIGAHPRINDLMKKDSLIEKMNYMSSLQYELFKNITGDEDTAITNFQLDLELKDGDKFDLGGITCEVMETPGHTRDSLSYWFPEIKTLIPGEALGHVEGKNGDIVQAEFLSSYDDYLASMKRLIELRPSFIGLAHGWYITDEDAENFLEETLKVTVSHRDFIVEYLEKAGGDVQKAIEIIAEQEYENKEGIFQEKNAYLANLTAQVRLFAQG